MFPCKETAIYIVIQGDLLTLKIPPKIGADLYAMHKMLTLNPLVYNKLLSREIFDSKLTPALVTIGTNIFYCMFLIHIIIIK